MILTLKKNINKPVDKKMMKLLIQTSKRNTFRTYSKDQKMLDETIKNKLQIDSLQVNKMIKTAPNLKNVQKNESRGYHDSFFLELVFLWDSSKMLLSSE